MIYQERRALLRIRNSIMWLSTVTVGTLVSSFVSISVLSTMALTALVTLLLLYAVTLVSVR